MVWWTNQSYFFSFSEMFVTGAEQQETFRTQKNFLVSRGAAVP